jgi:S-adenosylmethionine decarboxylase
MQSKIYNFQHYFESENLELYVTLESILTKLLNDSGFTILDISKHKFKPIGFTCIWLLGESHFAIHTFPEECIAYVELSSCVKKPFDLFVLNYLQKFNDGV